MRVYVCQTQIHLCAGAAASDSLLYGSWCHMATCQQAGGGNIILRRKLAVISRCTLVWESSQLNGRLDGTWSTGRHTLHISNFSPLSLSVFSPSVCFCPVLWPASGLSSKRSSELHYNVCGSFSAVSTQRYGFFFLFLSSPVLLFYLIYCLFNSFLCGLARN